MKRKSLILIVVMLLTVVGVSAQSCPDGKHPHKINLGLPSGTKWSCCNVGASYPETYGNYYAWGETETKSVYDDDTYKYYDKRKKEYMYLGSSICGTRYDVAHVKWGGTWQMPSFKQCRELVDNCRTEWVKFNGKNGCKFTGPNGNSIFLPAAGLRIDDGFTLWGMDFRGNSGFYFSGSQKISDEIQISGLSIGWNIEDDNSGLDINCEYTDATPTGASVRPVSK